VRPGAVLSDRRGWVRQGAVLSDAEAGAAKRGDGAGRHPLAHVAQRGDMTTPEPQPTSRLIRIASWIFPLVGMALAYSVLAWSSETDNTGKAWMAVGFGFVVVIWLVFRILVEQTALPRAVASGDAARILSITDKQLARKRGDAARGPFLVYRAFALESRGDHRGVLDTLAAAKPVEPALQLLAAALRVLALVEIDDVAGARRVLDGELEPLAAKLDARLHAAPHIHANLARGRLLLAEGAREEASTQLQKVVDNIHAGNAVRTRARELQSRS
jgi:hypothetical protein